MPSRRRRQRTWALRRSRRSRPRRGEPRRAASFKTRPGPTLTPSRSKPGSPPVGFDVSHPSGRSGDAELREILRVRDAARSAGADERRGNAGGNQQAGRHREQRSQPQLGAIVAIEDRLAAVVVATEALEAVVSADTETAGNEQVGRDCGWE